MIRLFTNNSGVNQSFIYPDLKTFAGNVLKEYLRGLV